MINTKAALHHHFLKIAVAQGGAEIPTDTEQDDVGVIVPPREGIGLTHRLTLHATIDGVDEACSQPLRKLQHYPRYRPVWWAGEGGNIRSRKVPSSYTGDDRIVCMFAAAYTPVVLAVTSRRWALNLLHRRDARRKE